MIEILKVVEKCNIYQNKGSQGSPGGGIWQRNFPERQEFAKIWKVAPGLPGRGVWSRLELTDSLDFKG